MNLLIFHTKEFLDKHIEWVTILTTPFETGILANKGHICKTLKDVVFVRTKVDNRIKDITLRNRRFGMAYEKQIGSDNPGCIIILVDQSLSMTESYGKETDEKQHVATRAVNSVIEELVTSCTDGEEIKDRCHVSVIGYGTEVHRVVDDMISEIGESPERLETVQRKESDGTGKVIEIPVQMPIWLEPKAENGTPMHTAFEDAYRIAEGWCLKYPNSFPPIVINITDGEPYDYEATQDAAKRVMELDTVDGNVLVFNIHIPHDKSGREVTFPHSTEEFDGLDESDNAKFLFNISSNLPESLVQSAIEIGLNPQPYARCLGYNTGEVQMIQILNFGSLGAMIGDPNR